VWIVGDGTSMHGVGDDWREIPTARPANREAQFFGLVAFGSDLWTAGFAPLSESHDRARGTVQRWNGTEWIDQTVPDVAQSWGLAGLGGVAADDLWAVGTVHATDGSPVALHLDGGEWHPVPVPLPDNGGGELDDVLALASDDVWASGSWRPTGTHQGLPLLVHWDGATWSPAEVPPDVASIRQLAATKDGLYAVGSAGDDSYVLRWGGAAWRTVPAPPRPAGTRRCSLHGAAVLPDGRLLVVGASNDSERAGQPYAAVQEL
jgi:hypothetical protein